MKNKVIASVIPFFIVVGSMLGLNASAVSSIMISANNEIASAGSEF